ncbi:MAG TPA: hypothetical protein VGQ49_19820 [Bryobacteraceae bacterium]|jgi:hypothetical protein|nr:hypothetical protein [Bryobacteraceae bacterium]
MADSFQNIFDALKPLFEEYEGRLAIQVDKPREYYLETRSAIYNGRRLQFGGVKIGKAYVSFHLMPIYMNPKLQATISPELKKRMQGKSCFNFTSVDPGQIAELKKLTKAGFDEFKTWGQKFGSSPE